MPWFYFINRLKRTFSKAANNWSVYPVKENKQYEYIPELMEAICKEYCSGKQALRSKVQLEEHHPKLLAKTIAPSSPPPSSQLAKSKVSRIKGVQKN